MPSSSPLLIENNNSVTTEASRLVGVNKSYGKGNLALQVLFDVSLTVKMGEMTFLVGPSGCGKTTLISIISGILSANSGEISLFGHRLDTATDKQKTALRKANLGFIFQQYHLVPTLTALENVAIPLLIDGISEAEAAQLAQDALHAVDLGSRPTAYPRELSGGQQQRVAIARALSRNPKLIICDEPTAALDGKTGQRVLELLKAVAVKPNSAVIVVTHDNRIYDYADRIISMNDGRIIGDERPHSALRGSFLPPEPPP
ncbi:MAG: ABC transporter ATP-binding protein [Vampirovibrionales bacterium]|nr:ABC transporter ATP-binding protein [Vampirovibrionales bacterium]